MANKGTKHSTVDPLVRAAEVHNNKYDYSQAVYTTMFDKIDIICPTHGLFSAAPKDHIYRKTGCPQCRNERMLITRTGKYKRWGVDDFISRAQQVHGPTAYDYSAVEYVNAHTPVEIICKVHGSWLTRPSDHIRGNSGLGLGCPRCSSKISKPERLIMSILDEHKIAYMYQYAGGRSDKNKQTWFDFLLPAQKVLIEYDGKQHYTANTKFPNQQRIVELDRQKTLWAEQNGFTLLRIPYTMTPSQLRNAVLSVC